MTMVDSLVLTYANTYPYTMKYLEDRYDLLGTKTDFSRW